MSLHQILGSERQKPAAFENIYPVAWEVNQGGLLGNESIQSGVQTLPVAVPVTEVYKRPSNVGSTETMMPPTTELGAQQVRFPRRETTDPTIEPDQETAEGNLEEPELEHEIVVRMRPRNTFSVEVEMQYLGRAKPRVVVEPLPEE